MRVRVIDRVVFALAALGLGACGGGTEDASLVADAGGDAGDATFVIPEQPEPESPGPDQDRETLLAAWGTGGAERTEGISDGGHALCDLGDVSTADLDELSTFDLTIPAFPYPSSVVHDVQARCGADPDTLLWRLLNCERISRGLTPLRCDLRVLWTARRHTADQLEGEFTGHEGSDASSVVDRAEDASLDWQAIGENVAASGTILSMHHGWMDSSGHRANILSTDFTYAAGSVGARPDGLGLRGTEVFVRFF